MLQCLGRLSASRRRSPISEIVPNEPSLPGHTWGQFVYVRMSPISIRICVQYLVTVRRSCRETDSWHEWEQDNFYGGSATKRIVIKEPSLIKASTWLGLASDSSKKFCHLAVWGLKFDACALSDIFEVMFFWQRRARKTCRNHQFLRRMKGSVSTRSSRQYL